jgi:hypothetical protein
MSNSDVIDRPFAGQLTTPTSNQPGATGKIAQTPDVIGGFATPQRSLVQRLQALERANYVRSRRAQLKRDIKSGRQPIDELLLNPPQYLEGAKVFDLLIAVRKYGRVKVNKILTQCRVSPSKTLGGLSPRQRTELVALMRRR